MRGRPPHPDSLRRRTVSRLRDRLARAPVATLVLVAAIVAVHLAVGTWDWRHGEVDGWGVLYGTRSKEALQAFGGRDRALVAAGQWARLWSCGLVHGSFVHLVLNLMALWGLGRLAEAIWGRVRAQGLFWAAVLGGALLSQLVGGPLAVGASGGVFGVLGALSSWGWTHRRALHPRLARWLTRGLWPWMALNLGMGFLVPGIDNPGHVGGLVVGVALGPWLADHVLDNTRPGGPGDRAAWLWLVGAWAAAAVGVFGR